MLYNNTAIAIPSVLSRTSIQNILGPTPTWILASRYGLLHGLISNSSAYKLWCHSVVKGHSFQTSYDLLALVKCMPTPVEYSLLEWHGLQKCWAWLSLMNQYIYVVSTLVMHVCMVYVCSHTIDVSPTSGNGMSCMQCGTHMEAQKNTKVITQNKHNYTKQTQNVIT